MKQKLNSIIICGVAFSLFLGGMAGFSNAFKTNNAFAFDYSKDSNSTTLTPAQLIEKITGKEVSDLERTYVNNNLNEFSLTYQNNEDNHPVEVIDFENTIYVNTESYSFTDKNNRKLSWIPYQAAYRNQVRNFSFNDGVYTCNFDNYNGLRNDISITYKLNISLNKNEVNNLLNAAYNSALPSYTKVVKNNETLEKYNSAVEAYEQYLRDYDQYFVDLDNYNRYLEEKNVYDIKNAAYQQYLEAYAAYEEELALYNQYLSDLENYNNQVEAYAQYLNDLEYYRNNYEANKEIYEAYQSSKVKIDYRLDAMKLITDKMTSYERTIYDAVLGDSVTSVLSRKDDIVSVGGVPANAVDRASVATSELRQVFRDYFSLENDAQKYEYYRLNWSHIRDNVNDLARCLNKFLHYDIVFNLLANQDNNRLEKYYILVAQLIYLADALNISPVYNYEGWNSATNTGSLKPNGAAYLDESYPIKVSQKGTKTYKKILEGTDFIDVSLKYGRPGPENYDQELIDLMTEPTFVAHPGDAPLAVRQPIAPTPVENPGEAPTICLNPGVAPIAVQMPTEPTYISLSEEEALLGNAAFEGKIVQRTAFTEDITVTFEDVKNYNFSSSMKHLVKFYDEDGDFVLEKVITNGVTISNSEMPDNNYDKIYVFTNNWFVTTYSSKDYYCRFRSKMQKASYKTADLTASQLVFAHFRYIFPYFAPAGMKKRPLPW